MKSRLLIIIAIVIPFTISFLMHAPVFGTDCKAQPFTHCHFGIFTPNPSFLIIPAFAQSLEDPECGPRTFLNEMNICEQIPPDSGIDMRGEGDKIISKVLILSIPVIVIAAGYCIWKKRK